MPYDDQQQRSQQRPAPTSSAGSETSTGGTTGYSPGGLAEQVATGASTAPTGSMSRDAMMGGPEQQQQQQSQDLMMQLKEQFQGVIVSIGQCKEQIEQLAATFPAAQQSLQPIIEQAIPQIGQMVMQAMMGVIQQIQAEPMMPPQV